jgi:hypothetical protein
VSTQSIPGVLATLVVITNSIPVVMITPVTATICEAEPLKLTASGASTYSWSPGGGSTAVIYITPAISSVYTVTGVNQNGCTATVSAKIIVEPCSGLNESSYVKSNMSIFPNPSTGLINIELFSKEESVISVMNSMGKLILEINVRDGHETIDLSDKGKGLYFVMVRTGKTVVDWRMLIE